MERNIRDVRDIFGRNPKSGEPKPEQELRSYDYSPRSRRRHEAMESYDNRTPNHHHHHTPPDNNRSNRKNSRHRSEDPKKSEVSKKSSEDPKSKSSEVSKKSSEASTKDKKSSVSSKDAAYYANRTLTERDIRHLERHLSMKKTIRKQISRNLHQAFVDDPDQVLNDLVVPITNTKSNSKGPDRTFTLTRAKVSRSEQNVLDLLKDNEPDSGHCSADNPNSSDDDSHHLEKTTPTPTSPRQMTTMKTSSMSSHSSNSRSVYDGRNRAEADGKFSFWKMFSVKNRGKR